MPFDISRNITYFNRVIAAFDGNLDGMLDELAVSPFIGGNSKIGFQKFRSNLSLLARYNSQQRGEAAGDPVSQEAAAAAWNEFAQQLNSLNSSVKDVSQSDVSPRGSEQKAFKDIISAFKGAFDLVKEHEKAIDRMNGELPLPDGDVPFDPEDARPYLRVLADKGVDIRLDAERVKNIGGLGDLNGYAQALSALRKFGAGEEIAQADLAGAWALLKKNTPAVLNALESKLSSTSPDAKEYDFLTDLQTDVMIADNMIRNVEARGAVRSFRLEERSAEQKIESVNREIRIYQESMAPGAEFDDFEFDDSEDGEKHGPDESEQRINQMRNRLLEYRNGLAAGGLPYELEMPRLNRDIRALKSQIPAGLLKKAETAQSFRELIPLDKQCKTEFDVAKGAYDRAVSAFRQGLKRIVEDMQIPSDAKKAVLQDLVSVMTMNTSGKENDAAAVDAALNRKLTSDPQKFSAYGERIRNVFQAHLPNCSTATAQLNEKMASLNAMDKVWEVRVLEGQKAIQMDMNRPARSKTIENLSAMSEANLRKKLKTLGNTLKGAHKFGFNTGEYRDFRTALYDAADQGDLKKLYDAAKQYVSKKGDHIKTDSGKTRMSIAMQTVDLLETTLGFGKLPVIPESEIEQPREPVQEEPQPAEMGEELNGGRELGAEENPAPAEPQEAAPAEPEVAAPVQEPEHPVLNLYFGPELFPDDPGNPPVYLSTGDKSVDLVHESTRLYIETRLFDRFGWDEETCRKTTDKMMNILDKNLTGNAPEDSQRIREEYRRTFVSPGDTGYPKLGDSSWSANNDIYVNMLTSFSQEYAVSTAKNKSDAAVSVDDYTDTIFDPALEGDGRNNIRIKQVEKLAQTLCRVDPDPNSAFNRSILHIAIGKNTSDKLRTFLSNISVEKMSTIYSSGILGPELEEKLKLSAKQTNDLDQQVHQEKVQGFRRDAIANPRIVPGGPANS